MKFCLFLLSLNVPVECFRGQKFILDRKEYVKMINDNNLRYRLWDNEGIPELGILAKPVGYILNVVGDLLRIQGDYSIYPPEETKRLIFEACSLVQPNGLTATFKQRQDILSLIEIMEGSNPTRDPALSNLMGGFWKLLYTTAESGGNVGKFGPFVGNVYQDLNPSQNSIKNIGRVDFPPIFGVLVADQSVKDSNSWQITFDKLDLSIFGVRIISKKFPANIVRIWEITYLDRDLRILRARQPDKSREESQIFVLRREEPFLMQ